jgi:transposase
MGEGKFVIYADESNVNLFLRRTQGRAQVGSRAVAKLPTSKGANIHMIAALTQTGLLNFQRKRGSYKSHNCNEWLREVLQASVDLGVITSNIILVCDNAPCHSRAEQVIGEFQGACLIRLAPYSPMMNPVEMAWSVIKSCIREKEAATLNEALTGHLQAGLSKTEFRLQYVEHLIDEARGLITPMKCLQFVNHCHAHFGDAIALKDMPVGQ